MIGEIIVGGFQYPEISRIFLRDPRVLSEHYPILVFDKERPGKPRLTTQFCDHRADLCMHVGEPVHQLTQFLQIVSVPSQVSIDKCCARVVAEYIMLLCDDSF